MPIPTPSFTDFIVRLARELRRNSDTNHALCKVVYEFDREFRRESQNPLQRDARRPLMRMNEEDIPF